MKVLGATIICFTFSIILEAIILPTKKQDEPDVSKQLSYTTVTYEFGKTDYEQFLNTLRNAVASPNRSCDLASTQNNPTADNENVLVQLKLSPTKWVTLGIDARNMYVWAYQDNVQYDQNFRANFVDDAPETATSTLFNGSTIRKTGFEGNYRDLERAARTGRENITLTYDGLRGDVESVYGKQAQNRQQEARFFLRAIQMVAEAARFRFIQKAIRDEQTGGAEFRLKLIAYETDWDDISQAIHKAEGTRPVKCQVISPTLVISDVGYRQEVNNVNEIKCDMGLLKYKNEALAST